MFHACDWTGQLVEAKSPSRDDDLAIRLRSIGFSHKLSIVGTQILKHATITGG
jgi:hypothetical protein